MPVSSIELSEKKQTNKQKKIIQLTFGYDSIKNIEYHFFYRSIMDFVKSLPLTRSVETFMIIFETVTTRPWVSLEKITKNSSLFGWCATKRALRGQLTISIQMDQMLLLSQLKWLSLGIFRWWSVVIFISGNQNFQYPHPGVTTLITSCVTFFIVSIAFWTPSIVSFTLSTPLLIPSVTPPNMGMLYGIEN